MSYLASFFAFFLFTLPLCAASSTAIEQLGLTAPYEPAATPRASVEAALFPEDGSRVMRAWYTSFEAGSVSAGLKAALAAERVELRDIKFNYSWIQDISLFGADGGLVLQADAPGDILEQLWLTTGVLNTEDGFPSLTALTDADAQGLKTPYRRMAWTFVEGGGLITGTLPGGAPYAITTPSPVKGARLFYARRKGVELSEAAARALVAEDLRVAPENLFIVNAPGHLDLIITPLPGGVLLLSDPARTAGALKEILAAGPTAGEKARLESMLKLYTEGWQPVYASGQPMGARQFPYSAQDLKVLDAVEAALAGRFKVERTAGAFKELQAYANSKDNFYVADRINFFNGFTGLSADGGVFQLTNGTRGLPALEAYWRALLAGHGAARAYFPGSYGSGAGVDCTGAPAGF